MSASTRNKRQMRLALQSVSTTQAINSQDHNGTDQNRPSRFCSLCHQITLDKQREDLVIDEQSNSLHVINTLLMATHLSSAVCSETRRKVEACIAMKAPNWPPGER